MKRAKESRTQGQSSSSYSQPLSAVEGLPEIGEENSLLGLLSDDTVLQILRNLHTRYLLSSPALVCRRWRRLCCSHLVLEIVPSPLRAYKLPWRSLGEEKIIELAMFHMSTLECLQFSRLKGPTLDKVIPLVDSLPRLKEFGLISCSLTEFELEAIADLLPSQLTSLDFHNDHLLTGSCEEACQNIPRPAMTTFIQKLTKRCPNLRHLDLDFGSNVSIDCLDNLLVAIPHIHTLHLQSDSFGWVEVSKIFQTCSALKSISVVSRCLLEEWDSSDEEKDTFLTRVKLRSVRKMPFFISRHADLGSLACGSLQSVRFYSSPHRSVPLDSTLPVLGLLKDKGQQLRHMHAQSLYNTSWHTISVWCSNLQTLDLSHAQALPYSATEVEEVVLSGLIRRLKGLEKLGLPSVSDRILIEIGRSCSKLKEFHFEGHASANGIIHNRTKVTDLGVVAVAEGCPNLQAISLSGCTLVSIASLRALAFHCKHLKALLLPGCIKINDAAFTTVWPRIGKSLLVLDLVGCKITSKAIGLISQQGKVQGTSLVVLAVSRALSNSAKAQLKELAEGLPSLQIFQSMAGLSWDGFFGSHSLDEMLPHVRTVN